MTPSDPDLTTLLAATARHDVAAFRRLYDLAWPRLARVARRLMGDGALAEDVLQLAFVRVWQRAGDYDGTRGSAMGWMLRICRNAALDELRKARADQARDAQFAVAWQAGDAVPAVGLDMDDCLAGLPHEQAHALVAVYVEGLTHAELARRSGAPLGTVKSRVRRALLAVRRNLGGGPQ